MKKKKKPQTNFVNLGLSDNYILSVLRNTLVINSPKAEIS